MDRRMINTPMGRAIKVAMTQFGVHEIEGPQHEPEVLKYFHDIGHEWVDNDEMAWCSAFANWVLKYCGFIGTNQLNARSFLDAGKPIDLWNAQSGDVVILWRDKPDSWQGHVGFLANYNEHFIWVLGGNQSNEVNITKYPIGRLLGVRRMQEDPFF